MNKITIIVPIFKVNKEYLKQCINSIIEQTLKEIDIILIDDGADEEIANLCDKYRIIDNRIKVIHQSNQGVSTARNEGIKKATSSYVMFVDADDWIEKDCCERLYNCVEKNKNIDIVFCSYYKNYIDREEKYEILKDRQMIECNNTNINYLDMKIIGTCWSKLYSTRILSKEKFNGQLTNGEDVEFNFRVFKKATSILGLNEYLYHYRIQDNSLVRGYNPQMIENYTKTIKCMKEDILEKDNEIQYNAFYSFGAVAYLMICMNMIFTKEFGNSYIIKKKFLKNLSKEEPYRDILKNSNKVKLPFSRKLPLILAKYHIYCGLNFMIKVKKCLMSR